MFEKNETNRKSTNFSKNPLNEVLQEDISRPDTLRNRSSSIIEKMTIFDNGTKNPESSRNTMEEARNSVILSKNKFTKIFDDKSQKFIWIENNKINSEENSSETNIDINLNTETKEKIESPQIIETTLAFKKNSDIFIEKTDNPIENTDEDNPNINENKDNAYDSNIIQTESEDFVGENTEKQEESNSKFYHEISNEREMKQDGIKIQGVDFIKEKPNSKNNKNKENYNEVINSSLSNVTNPESVINISNFNVNHHNYNSIFQTLRSNELPTLPENKDNSGGSQSIVEVKTDHINNTNFLSRNNKIYLGIIAVLILIIIIFVFKSLL
jgi:hypothetical protein